MGKSESKEERRFSQEQYDMLKRCSDKKDITEWNEWREKHPDEVIWLQGRNFNQWWLQKANFMHGSTFKNNTYTKFGEVHLEGTHFEWADLRKAIFAGADSRNTFFICDNDGWICEYARKCSQFLGTHIGESANDFGVCSIGCACYAVCCVVYIGRTCGKICRGEEKVVLM